MRAGWRWYSEGMEPLTIVVYDHIVTSIVSGERRTERRIVTIQGTKMVSDYIIDFMEGW